MPFLPNQLLDMKKTLIIILALAAFIIGRYTASPNVAKDSDGEQSILEIVSEDIGVTVDMVRDGGLQVNHNKPYWIYSYSYDLSHYDGTRNRIVVIAKNDEIIAKLIFPRADTEVKNFGVDSISSFSDRLFITTEWGGGNNYYDVNFSLTLKDDKVLLETVHTQYHNLLMDSYEDTEIAPMIFVSPDGLYMKKYY
ncbi:hypothetical protein PDESU_03102 [Pontiella desulfatans]|uniref:Uncharacterized protein n=1 Tax=Pontiella desulfatans TaxID=2750659 RepID=A0A6C2U3Z8_PONDE|nr:hypothetical protein [Pontiella desulfatans]VGO14539.1 hypothetical protein PDESU_03102 [Pontiella desulfatans]